MQSLIVALAFAASSTALVARQQSCCFDLTAHGSASGIIGQLSDGQNRIGGNLPAGKYCIDFNGGITDGRGCILTPPTTQFQCDEGATPTPGFSINFQTHELQYNGSPNFYECPTGQNGEDNIFSILLADNTACQPISLTTSGCYGNSQPAPQPAPSPPCTTPASNQCPANLQGPYQFPHLIVPVNSAESSKVYGTSFNGQVTSTVSSIYNFDIPQSYSGQTCSLVFLFPGQSQLTTSSYTESGSGKVSVCQCANIASEQTTYDNAPHCSQDYGNQTLKPGNSYTIATFPCPAGSAVAFEISSGGSDTSLQYFQDYNPSPIGLYITSC